MKHLAIMIIFCLLFSTPVSGEIVSEKNDVQKVFESLESKDEFARELSFLLGKAWEEWQNDLEVDGIEIDGSGGVLFAGGIKGPELRTTSIMRGFDREDKYDDYTKCMWAVAQVVSNGMIAWQKGYQNDNIPFPQGANCVYTLTPCHNIAVTIGSGFSDGDQYMAEKELYNSLARRVTRHEKGVLTVLRGAALAISSSFQEWKESCLITDILAKGGVAPQPSPMGAGPGRVRGAKGSDGKLSGAYLDSDRMYRKMNQYFVDTQNQ